MLALGWVTAAQAAPPIDVSDTSWSMVGRIHYSGASSPDLTNFQIALHGDGSFSYEIADDQGQPLTFTGFWVQKKNKLTLTFDEASRSEFEDAMGLSFTAVGFRVDFEIKKWEIQGAIKGTESEPKLKFKYRFKSRYVFHGREDKRRSFGFSFSILGDGTPAAAGLAR